MLDTHTTRSKTGSPRHARLAAWLAWPVAAAWPVAILVADAVQPEITGEPGIVDVLLSTVISMGLLTAVALLAARLRVGMWVSLGTAAAFAVGVATCLMGGHTGAWLATQGVLAAGMLGVSWAGLSIRT